MSYRNNSIIFYTELAEIRKRKENDKTRKRSNFEKHLQFIEPQKKYFKFLKEHTTLNVEFVNYDDIDIAKNEVMSLVNSYDKQEMDEEKIFKNIIKWLKVNN